VIESIWFSHYIWCAGSVNMRIKLDENMFIKVFEFDIVCWYDCSRI
jgi:hypothetical protein